MTSLNCYCHKTRQELLEGLQARTAAALLLLRLLLKVLQQKLQHFRLPRHACCI
jgi:hypothetical protein